MKYFLVTAKCGHVGNGKYLEIDFPIFAQTKKDAAQICLKKPKVKKQLKDAITLVREVDWDIFNSERNAFLNNSYVRSHTKREITDWLESVQDLNLEKHWKRSFVDRKERVLFIKKKNRLMEDSRYEQIL